jgi:hypothetical protein
LVPTTLFGGRCQAQSQAGDEPGCLEVALELAVIQRSELAELMDAGDNLLRRLREQTDKLTF